MWKKGFVGVELLLMLVGSSVLLVVDGLRRDEYPPHFVFGASTSAYQVEGAANEDGRKPSIWDTFAHAGNANMYKGDGDIACDQYHKYKEDVQLMKKMGLDAYRFSISWSRLIPDGRGPINQKGLQYYNNLINELISQGIQAHVTLYHWDLPQALEDEYGGWVNKKIVRDFTTYADACFREFGDRVKHWTTVNEGNAFVKGGYDLGYLPPQHCSPPSIYNCSKGDSSNEPYLATHNMLLAHASVARLYRNKYQGNPKSLCIKDRDYVTDMAVELTGQQTHRSSSLEDWPRIKYLQEYIGSILHMQRNGHDIRGYFVWSFMDVFELLSGYEFTYGLYYIDLKDPTLRRQPKLSSVWYSNFLNNRTMDPMVAMQIEKNSSLHDAI
ncbi:hypothetical protein HN51_022814 [Arachis hypogaea]